MCNHFVLLSKGKNWQCCLCGKELTNLDLVIQRNQRKAEAKK